MTIKEKFDSKYQKLHWQPGNRTCPGCTGGVYLRYMLETIVESEKKAIIWASSPCGNPSRMMANDMPKFTMNFSSGPDTATGLQLALEVLGEEDTIVISGGGDGLVSDIGFNKVSACAERNQNMIQFMADNEAYMNTGIQKSGQTPFGAWTTTTPGGKRTNKKYLPMIMAQHGVPYVATLSIAHSREFKNSFRKALDIKGYRFLHILMPCPTGWRCPTEKAIEVGRLAVQTWIWPLYEVENGVLKMTLKPKPRPVKDYFEMQGRFRNLTEEDIKTYQKNVDHRREKLLECDEKEIVF